MERKLLDTSTASQGVHRIKLTWTDITLHIALKGKQKGAFKEILKGVSGSANPGELLAILGTSGAGKTSLMNALNGWIKNTKGRVLTGEVRANGQLISDFDYTMFTGYVLQEDILMATMTVFECMQFSTVLRLQGTKEFKQQRAEEIVNELLLTNVRNSRIGDEKLRGISGGEKKRVCIGVELITNPSMLFLDEPTSGLDSFTAFSIMKLIKDQAKMGRTVICTLHQPSSQIVTLVDKLLVMSNGHIVYHDVPRNCRNHFESLAAVLGHKFPDHGNPADFLMHIISSRDLVGNTPESRDAILVEAYRKTREKDLEPQNLSTIEELQSLERKVAPWSLQFSTLFVRAFKEAVRDPTKVRLKIILAIYLSVIYVILYHNLAKNRESIQNRYGLLYMVVSAMIFTGIDSIALSFPKQRAVFLKEQGSKMYGVLPYYLSKLVLDLYQELISPTLIFLIVYWSCDLNTTSSEKPLLFWFLCVLTHFSGSSIGLIIGCSASNISVTLQLIPVFAVPMMVYSGFLVNYDSLPVGTAWLSYLSPYRYSFSAFAENEFHGISFSCEDDAEYPCHPLSDLNLSFDLTTDILILASISISLRILAGFMLKLLVKRISD